MKFGTNLVVIYFGRINKNLSRPISPWLKLIKNIGTNGHSSFSKLNYQYVKLYKKSSPSAIFKIICKPERNIGGKILLGLAFFGSSVFIPESTSGLHPSKDTEESFVPLPQENRRDRKSNGRFSKLLFAIYEAFRILLRMIQLGVIFLPIFILYPISYLGSYSHELWWKMLLTGIEFSGPIFIKFGQWASTRRDIFPDTCCNQFSRLQRRSKPHAWHYTKYQLIKSFGKNWRKTFVKFDNNGEPIGSGCVAQVYKVWMCEYQIKNKDILDEIIQEHEDNEDEGIYNGLEVLGFRNLIQSVKHEFKEQEEAIMEWKKSRGKHVKEKEDKMCQTKVETFSQSIKGVTKRLDNQTQSIGGVTNKLADEIMYPRGKLSKSEDKSKKNLNQSNIPIDLNQSNLMENENIEHALVEQWQHGGENLEKSLPVSEDQHEKLDGLVPVAVKVLHPGVFRNFRRDIVILKMCAFVISTMWPPLRWLSLAQCIEEFSKVMALQIDLRKEGQNLEKFSESFANLDAVKFPRPIRPFVTRSVLVETFEEGEPMLNFITDDKPQFLKKNVAKIGVDALLKMIFVDNFVHGDLHPGNIIVQNEPATEGDHNPRIMMVDVGVDTFVMDIIPDPKPLRLCILDCGIVATLKEKDLGNFKAVFHQVVLGHGESVADLFLMNSEHSCKNPEEFRKDMSDLVQTARMNSISLGQVDVGILLQQVLILLVQHHIRLDSAFSSIVLAVFVLEGLGRSLDPDMDILERARSLFVS